MTDRRPEVDHEKILERVRRLLRLAESSNIHEAASAAARAQELMARHRIEAAALLPAGLVEKIRDLRDAPLEASKRLRPWKIELASVVARANGCRIYVLEGRDVDEIIVVGRVEDAEPVRLLYGDLVTRVEALTRKETEGRDRGFCNAFRLGVVTAIEERLARANTDARATAASELVGASTALALARLGERDEAVDRFMEETLRLRGSSKGLRADARGFARGRRAGEALALEGRPSTGSPTLRRRRR